MPRVLLFIFVVAFSSVSAAEAPWNPIPEDLSVAHQAAQSAGCRDCHSKTDAPTMHTNPSVVIGCADCHGGDPKIRASKLAVGSKEYTEAKKKAHIQPDHPEWWPGSANPKGSYTNLLKESLAFVRFMNPGDLRVAPETCGSCHTETVLAVQKSMMTSATMFFGGASYNNNILPYKTYFLGESYNRDGQPRSVFDANLTGEVKARGGLEKFLPLPQWEVVAPGDNFRIFERGGLFVKTQFPDIGLPNPLEEPGKPDVLQSNRGPGTGSRISVPLLNIHKTRLNDPHLSFLGTNDHPGDYRSSGCTSCHTIYANDREPLHSGPYAAYGNSGKSQTTDPTIPRDEPGHPLQHVFTRAIPTSQCMVCHMHQPNMFVNSYLGYTMWDYEADAPFMWPKKQKYPTDDEVFKSLRHNPEEAATRGLWTDDEFLRQVINLNSEFKNTQMADYHGHGWNFRAVFKKDRKGNLLDKDNNIVSPDDPMKFKKAVHLKDIHLEKGMHCADCHFGQDAHGDGHIYGEVAQAVEITCKDCHGTLQAVTNLRTSGPAAGKEGNDFSLLRTAFGPPRFEWQGDTLYQNSSVTENVRWRVPQIKESIDPASRHYNEKAARAKTVKNFTAKKPEQCLATPAEISSTEDLAEILAHSNEEMACFTCHSSWVTSCAGCHLPIEANWKQKSKHFDGKETRNWASYNPQVVRDQMFQIGKHGPVKNSKTVPVRSSSALVLSSTDINRQKIYVQQPPTAASGHSSQAFAPHFPHTVRTTETKGCTDCHISSVNDNNAIMAQLFLLGTNFVNFIGYHAYVALGDAGLEAVQVTEWNEPQAVIGSYLQRYAYPDWYEEHQERKQELQTSHVHHGAGGATNTIQLRGEYLYTTAGTGGFRVYDVANIANKGFSERIVTAPFSPLGQDTHVASEHATSFALPTNMPVAPFREQAPENLETPLHPIYHYAAIVDSSEGLILVNVDTLADGDRTNNFLERALTWNPDGILTGAKHITLTGARAFVTVPDAVHIIDLDMPLEPVVTATIPLRGARSTAVQFRYLFVTSDRGFHVIDVTQPDAPIVSEAFVPLQDAQRMYLARTYAYIANGGSGLAIVDITRPESPFLFSEFDADGRLNDTRDVQIGSTNASLFAYVADGVNGLKVLQLTDPERVPTFYGFSPEVKPKLIAWKKTAGPAIALSKGLDRDRAVDETGHQVSVFGRIGSRPFTLEEMEELYLKEDGTLYTVKD